MDEDRRIAETVQRRKLLLNSESPLRSESRPDLVLTYDLTLVRRGYWRWRANDYRSLPDLNELANDDVQWEGDLDTYAEWVKFHEDQWLTNQ